MKILNRIEKNLLIPGIPFFATGIVSLIDFNNISISRIILLSLFIFIGYLYTKIPQCAKAWRTTDNDYFESVKNLILILRSFVVMALIIIPIVVLVIEVAPPHLKSSINDGIKQLLDTIGTDTALEKKGVAVKNQSGQQFYIKITVTDSNGNLNPSIEIDPIIHLSKNEKLYITNTMDAFDYFENDVVKPAVNVFGWIIFILTLLSVIMIYYAEIFGQMQRSSFNASSNSG